MKSTQLWFSVGLAVVSTALLLAGKIDVEAWKWAVILATGGLGLRKALEHVLGGKNGNGAK